MSNREPVRVLLLENIHPVAVENLEKEGFKVKLEARAYEEPELVSMLSKFDAVGIRSKTEITAKALEAAPNLLTIGAFCIGTNQISLSTANSLGVPVFNAPYSNTRSVAEMVICEIIALSRQLGDRNINAHKGVWQKSAEGSREVRGKILGIVGYGHIGSQVSVLAEALGMKVIYYDIHKKLPLGNSMPMPSLAELLKHADFVSLHVPETNQTKDMMGAEELAFMKPGSYLINASRGTVVVIDALVAVLKTKKLAGAAIDVFPLEPTSTKEVFKSELQGLANVILTPHVGGSTEEAQESIGREVSHSLISFLKSGSTTGAVNFPRVDLHRVKDARRILNVHKNVPGVLGEINSIVSDLGANINAQYLATDAHIGYLVMDMEHADADAVCERVTKLKTSIKTRVVY